MKQMQRLLFSTPHFFIPLSVIFIMLFAAGCGGKQTSGGSVARTERASGMLVGYLGVGGANSNQLDQLSRAVYDLYGAQLIQVAPIESLGASLPTGVLKQAGKSGLDAVLFLQIRSKRELGANAGGDVTVYSMASLSSIASFPVDPASNIRSQTKSALSRKLAKRDQWGVGDRLKIAHELEKRGELAAAVEVLKAEKQSPKASAEKGSSRLREVEKRLSRLQKAAAEDAQLKARLNNTYRLDLEYRSISTRYQTLFASVVDEAKFRSALVRYTNKPTKLWVTFDPEKSSGSITLDLKYHGMWYRRASAKHPKQIGNRRVLTFKPYFRVMDQLLKLREGFAGRVAPEQRGSIMKFEVSLRLKNRKGQSVRVIIEATDQGKLRAPRKIVVKAKGKPVQHIEPIDKVVYQRTGMFALGPAKDEKNKPTPYAFVYEFFELKEELRNIP